MTMFVSFIQYAVKVVMYAAVACVGIFLGKKLRDRKDAKTGEEQK
ncbi:vanadium nitrogenase [Lachnospiraceae bacterium 45-W7]